mmetsp:Transcript_12736/g.28294  ORF Transcript_12736/g.28294 Transcript_12736/m.28294 type:complete len:192 (-) Transcript_12736:662-1237(-)
MRPHLSLISLLVCLGLVASSEPLACELKTRHEQCRADETAGALTTYSPERTDPRRVVAVGDVHGAFDGLLQVLYSANVTASPTHCEWREQGAGTVLVQVRDLVDRGAHSYLLTPIYTTHITLLYPLSDRWAIWWIGERTAGRPSHASGSCRGPQQQWAARSSGSWETTISGGSTAISTSAVRTTPRQRYCR